MFKKMMVVGLLGMAIGVQGMDGESIGKRETGDLLSKSRSSCCAGQKKRCTLFATKYKKQVQVAGLGLVTFGIFCLLISMGADSFEACIGSLGVMGIGNATLAVGKTLECVAECCSSEGEQDLEG